MSHTVKAIAAVALPIVGNFIAPGIGGVIGGAIGGALNGGIKGAIIGGIGGGLAGESSIFADGGLIGNAGQNTLTDLGSSISSGVGDAFSGIGDALSSGAQYVGNALGITSGASGVGDAASTIGDALSSGGAGVDSLGVAGGVVPGAASDFTLSAPTLSAGANATSPAGYFSMGNTAASPFATGGAGAGSVASSGVGSIAKQLLSPVSAITGIANTVMTQEQADAAKKASQQQTTAINTATQNYAPYSEVGTAAAKQLGTIQADPNSYIQNNPMYTSLADDAQRRLEASQASKGKVASGGTQAALQDQLLQIGNGLVQQQEGNLQNTVNTGVNAASGTANLQTAGGVAQSAGTIGQANAYQNGYNNQIQTLLALQGLNKTPTYQPQGGYNI